MARLKSMHPFKKFKRFLPHHLWGRVLLILLAPLLLATTITTYVFIDRHWDNTTRHLAEDIAGDIAATVELAKSQGMDDYRLRIFARKYFSFDATLLPHRPLRQTLNTPLRNIGASFLEHALHRHIQDPYVIALTNDTIFVSVTIPNRILHLAMSRKRLLSKSTPVFMMWLLGTPLIFFIIAALFLHKQVRPIRRLAEAVDRFGKGQAVQSFKPAGAFEVRQAAIAFNRMRSRIARQIQQRTEMLAGVSHDLRTPLTRMSLQLAMLEDLPGVQELQADVKEMSTMVEAYLSFARGEDSEPAQPTLFHNFLNEIIVPTKAEVKINCDMNIVANIKRQSMKRCIVNLLENSQRYASEIWVEANKSRQWFTILIDDNGPGIPAAKHKDVFKPFYRIDTARNLNSPHTGLGLAIAQDTAHQHGGNITLHDSPHGGLRVKIRLPA